MPRLQICLIGRQLRRVRPGYPRQPYLKSGGDGQRDFILDGEDVRHLPVVALRPEMTPIGSGDQLGDDANPAARTPYATFENIRNTERLGDFADVFLFASEGEGGSSRDDFEPRPAGQVSDDLFGQAI